MSRYRFLAAVLAALPPWSFACGQTITEYPVTTAGAFPLGITSGPDGNLWFTEQQKNKIGRISPTGTVTEFTLPGADSFPAGIAAGPDGNVWFTEIGPSKIGRITPAGTITEFQIPTLPAFAQFIAAGPDGNLWFTENFANKIGRVTPAGVITEFVIPTASSGVSGIAAGPDGNLWFAEFDGKKIGRITPAGTITEFVPPGSGDGPDVITAGPDGALWYTRRGANRIGRVTTAGAFSEFDVAGTPAGIATGPDGNLWFTQNEAHKVARLTTAGVMTEFPLPSAASHPHPFAIVAGPDGAMWFTSVQGNTIGRITTSGLSVTPATNMAATGTMGGPFTPSSFDYQLKAVSGTRNFAITGLPPWLTATPASGTANTTGTTVTLAINSNANALAAGSYGPVTVTFQDTGSAEFNTTRTATLTVGSQGPTSLVAAVLPASRSVKVGVAATAFITLINSGSNVGLSCGLALGSSVPATFSYRTTDPATNAVTGTANTPVAIAAGAPQSFVFAITPTAPFAATEVKIDAKCSNSELAPSVVGLNTLLLSGSATDVPDIVALGATLANDGIVNVSNGSGVFAVATVNVGIGADIVASADTGSASLPLSISLCQTNPATGACTSATGPQVTTTIGPNATPTFAIFVQGLGGNVPFSPAVNRIFVRFKEPGGAVRGATSVAVRTQ